MQSFGRDDEGLTPIVGAVLMVIIAIITAAVIGSSLLSYDITPEEHYERFKEITKSQNIEGSNLPEGLVARWTFDSTLKDATGNCKEGIPHNGDIGYGNGVSGKAVRVNKNNWVEVPSSESLNITKEVTIVTYAKWTIDPSNADNYANIVCKGGSFDNDISYRLQHGCWNGSNNVFEFAIDRETYGYGYTFIPSSTSKKYVMESKWYQIAGTYDGSKMALYINGNKFDEKSVSGDLITSNKPLCIGSSKGERHFVGLIDEVQIYDRALSESEINSIGI